MPGRSMNVMNDASLGEFAAVGRSGIGRSGDQGCRHHQRQTRLYRRRRPRMARSTDWRARAAKPRRRGSAATSTCSWAFIACSGGSRPRRSRLSRRSTAPHSAAGLRSASPAIGASPLTTRAPCSVCPKPRSGSSQGSAGRSAICACWGRSKRCRCCSKGRACRRRRHSARGLVDETAPAAELVARAKEWIGSAPPEAIVKPWDKPGFTVPGADPRTLAGVQAFSAANAMQRAKTYGNYPALDAIQSVVYRGMLVPIDTGLRIEAKAFVKLMRDPRARNMVRTQFINLQQANKLARRPAAVARKRFSRIGVLGAGLMGSGIAHVAARAGIDVALLDVSEEAAGRGLDHIRRQQQAAVERGRATEAEARSIVARVSRLPTTRGSPVPSSSSRRCSKTARSRPM